MMKFDSTEDHVNYDELQVKLGKGFLPSDYNNIFVTEDLLLKPLYKKIEFDPKLNNYNFFPFSDVRVECYCNECKARRIFCFENSKLATCNIRTDEQISVGTKLEFTKVFNFKAKADCGHIMFINFVVVDDNHVMKIGQYPSIYDLNEEINNKKFLKLLDKEYSNYYKSACSLYSFNTCIGAMVYLRRIFEKILIDTFNENSIELLISFDDFQKKRMEDKVKVLKKYLPAILFETGFVTIYSQISNGIHNLTEEQCASMFPILKSAIEEVLIDKIELQEKERRRKELSSKLSSI